RGAEGRGGAGTGVPRTRGSRRASGQGGGRRPARQEERGRLLPPPRSRAPARSRIARTAAVAPPAQEPQPRRPRRTHGSRDDQRGGALPRGGGGGRRRVARSGDDLGLRVPAISRGPAAPRGFLGALACGIAPDRAAGGEGRPLPSSAAAGAAGRPGGHLHHGSPRSGSTGGRYRVAG